MTTRIRIVRAARNAALALLLVAGIANAAAIVWSVRTARADELRYPPVGRFVEIDGARVHYLRLGTPDASAPTLVFLHGASTSLMDAVPDFLPALAEHFEVVAIDRPGHGYSERGEPDPDSGWVDPAAQARRVAGTLRALDIERAVWIGHSWAGAVVTSALLELGPEEAAAGVVLAGAIYPWDTGTAWHAQASARPVIGAWFAYTFIEPVGRLALDPALEHTFAPEPVPANYVEETATLLSLRPTTYRANARDLTRLSGWLEDVASRYPDIDRPLLSIAAGADRIVPPVRHADRLEAARPETETVTLEGAGHGLLHTRTARIVEEIADFVRRLET